MKEKVIVSRRADLVSVVALSTQILIKLALGDALTSVEIFPTSFLCSHRVVLSLHPDLRLELGSIETPKYLFLSNSRDVDNDAESTR